MTTSQTVHPEPFAAVTDLADGDPLTDWRCLVGADAQIRLLTAMGDVFLLKPRGLLRRPGVFLLDTASAQLNDLQSDWQTFKERIMANPDKTVGLWLKYDLLAELTAMGKILHHGQCFSPTIPPFLGGPYQASNFEPTPWRVHLSILGQTFTQVKDLPPGTQISGFRIK